MSAREAAVLADRVADFREYEETGVAAVFSKYEFAGPYVAALWASNTFYALGMRHCAQAFRMVA